MNVLVCTNTHVIGGASLDAVDLAASMQQRGHRMTVLCARGPLVERIRGAGLEWIESVPEERDWPSPGVIAQIRRIARSHDVDLIHAYEWPRTLEAGYGAHLVDGVPLVSSILSIVGPKYLPRSANIVAGTADVRDHYRSLGFRRVTMIEPVIDLPRAGQQYDTATFRATHGLDDGVTTIFMASRLSGGKLEGLRLAIDAIAMVDGSVRAQLVIAGHGDGEAELRERAALVNDRLGREAVLLTGLLSEEDVDVASSTADLVLGMGTSLLRGMAQGKPAIVVGREGFSALVSPDTASALVRVGFWGMGPPEGATERLAATIADALRDPERTAALAACALDLVRRRPTREEIEGRVEDLYRAAVADVPSMFERGAGAGRSIGRFVAMRARARVTSARGAR